MGDLAPEENFFLVFQDGVSKTMLGGHRANMRALQERDPNHYGDVDIFNRKVHRIGGIRGRLLFCHVNNTSTCRNAVRLWSRKKEECSLTERA